jgi:aminoglycoside 6'-N-acetyltransferase I
VAPPITIQEVGLESLETALSLLERFFLEEGFSTPTHEMRASLQTMITSPNSAVFLARHDTEAVGVATVNSTVGIEYGRSAELEDLYVPPDERGRGVASTLIEAVCAWCQEKRVNVILVTVTPGGETRHALLDFYQRRGFTNTKRIVMQREIGAQQ